jgi:hypothetical protein
MSSKITKSKAFSKDCIQSPSSAPLPVSLCFAGFGIDYFILARSTGSKHCISRSLLIFILMFVSAFILAVVKTLNLDGTSAGFEVSLR